MATGDMDSSSGGGLLHGLVSIPGRAAAATVRPVAGAMEAAWTAGFEAGVTLERRVVDRILDSEELERVLAAVFDSPRVQAGILKALESDGAKNLIDSFFDSGLFAEFLQRLSNHDALWGLVDEIAGSPAVTAAISQQGLGFADQMGGEVRARSRKADDWIERTTRRLTHRNPKPGPAAPGASAS
jgi:hypothetical protein